MLEYMLFSFLSHFIQINSIEIKDLSDSQKDDFYVNT